MLQLSRFDALWVEPMEAVILAQLAYYERETGKKAMWERDTLERIAKIYNRLERESNGGQDTENKTDD